MARPDARLDVELRLRLKRIAYEGLVVIRSIETAGIHYISISPPYNSVEGYAHFTAHELGEKCVAELFKGLNLFLIRKYFFKKNTYC